MSEWDGKERRSDAVMIAEILKDLKTLLVNQAEIKDQVKKTNGRVTAIERCLWTAAGGVGCFVLFELAKFIEVLNK